MVRYDDLAADVKSMPEDSVDWRNVVARLVQRWVDDYAHSLPGSDIVETDVGGFSYLFDVDAGRLIAAWGISQGRHAGDRPSSRMAGHPLGAGASYHRGHAIPHRLGGGTDINLVPQLGSINIGPFRALENEGVATPGALYFTYWRYVGTWQRPAAVDQGLMVPGKAPNIVRHCN